MKEVSHAVLDIQHKLYKFINPSRNYDAVIIMVSTAKVFCHILLAAHFTLLACTACNVAGIDTFAYCHCGRPVQPHLICLGAVSQKKSLSTVSIVAAGHAEWLQVVKCAARHLSLMRNGC